MGLIGVNVGTYVPWIFGLRSFDMFGSMYLASQSVVNIGTANTYEGAVNLSAGELRDVTFTDDNTYGDYLTIPTGGAGRWAVFFGVSFSGPTNADMHMSVFVNTTESAVTIQRTTGAASAIGNAAMPGIIDLEDGDQIRLKFKSDVTGNYTGEHAWLVILKLD
jgi:hypothetical protein